MSTIISEILAAKNSQQLRLVQTLSLAITLEDQVAFECSLRAPESAQCKGITSSTNTPKALQRSVFGVVYCVVPQMGTFDRSQPTVSAPCLWLSSTTSSTLSPALDLSLSRSLFPSLPLHYCLFQSLSAPLAFL